MNKGHRSEEDRYEAIQLIVKSRTDGKPWVDIISDLLMGDCQGSETEPYSCGTESMGGTTGTLDQCYQFQGIADDVVEVKKDDVLLVLSQLATSGYENALPGLQEAITRLHHECTWWEEWLASLPDDEKEKES